MTQSPGHRKWPDHQVREVPLQERVQAAIGGEIVADSTGVIRVDEDGNPPRYYFPRSDVQMEKFERSATETTCPFKGTGHYFTFASDGHRVEDVAWSYEEPYDEHQALKDRIAFYEGEKPEVAISRPD